MKMCFISFRMCSKLQKCSNVAFRSSQLNKFKHFFEQKQFFFKYFATNNFTIFGNVYTTTSPNFSHNYTIITYIL